MHAIHDGKANTYTLTKDGVKNNLKLLKDKEEKYVVLPEYVFLMEKSLSKV